MKIKDIIRDTYRVIVLLFFIAGIVCFCFSSPKMIFIGICLWGFCFVPALIWNARNDYYIEYEEGPKYEYEESDEDIDESYDQPC